MILLSPLLACGDDPSPTGPAQHADRPLLVCPGDPQCPDNDGELRAGAAVRSVVPACWEAWEDADGNATYDPIGETWSDCGCDRVCPADPGWTAPDEGEGDGVFQAIWIAGFQNSRPVAGVRDARLGFRGEGDGLYATALVLDQGGTRVGLVSVDAFGLMIDDTDAMARDAEAAGLDLDHLAVTSTHSHASPDVLGIYGPNLAETGYDAGYVAEVRAHVVDALAEAVAGLEPVTMTAGSADADDYHPAGVGNLVSDTRDPQIVDAAVGVARFAGTDGATVATLVHFANHPEETADDWALLTANYVHALRETVEDGVDWGDGPRPGVGGVTVFLSGTLGGMMTSLRADVEDPNGVVWPDSSFEKSDALGQILGGIALDAIAAAEPVEPRLAARRDELYLPVENNGFQAMFLMGVLAHRQIYHYDESQPVSGENVPEVRTQVSVVEVGDLRLLFLPGEPLPELSIGGYDGSATPPDTSIVDPYNVNPPDLAAAPPPPYLKEVLGGRFPWVIGLGNDQIGYVIPEAHFELGAVPYLLEAEGHHYEETNSLGPGTAPAIVEVAERLIRWTP